jgi:DNA-cytosine methyltransferase
MKNGINVLSLFDGLSCGNIALEKAGIKVNNYYASEIDKWAIQIANKNYPNIIQLGDVTKFDETQLPKIDLLIGGSPCQGFSFAGKQLNFDDPRSKLFFVYVYMLKQLKPKYFLLENVRMSKQSQDVISEHLGVQPIKINSGLVSAQNRVRLYWTNIPNVTQPEDKGLKLKDILEIDGYVDRDKSHCLDANYFKGGNLKSYFEKHRRQLVFSNDGLCHVGDADINGHDLIKRVYHPDGKAPTLNTMGGGNREPKVLCGALRGRYKANGKTEQQLELRKDSKTNSLTTVQKDNLVIEEEQLTYRKLTPLECERLQTIPDGYTSGVSNSQRYRMLGNSWTADIIAHLFKGIK